VQTLAWTLVPTRVMRACARTLGDSFTLTMWPSGLQLVMVSDPDDVKAVFTAPAELAPSGAGNSPVASVMGEHSVIVLTGPEHLRQRKLLLPPFHGERMREYENVIVAATLADMERWPVGEPMRLHERTRRITLEVIVRAVFGVEAERMGPLRTAIEGFLAPMDTLRMLRFALKPPSLERPTGAFGAGLDAMDALIYEEIARHREQDLGTRTDTSW
jgi:cytochrome P450